MTSDNPYTPLHGTGSTHAGGNSDDAPSSKSRFRAVYFLSCLSANAVVVIAWGLAPPGPGIAYRLLTLSLWMYVAAGPPALLVAHRATLRQRSPIFVRVVFITWMLILLLIWVAVAFMVLLALILQR
jgi:hypothetical protein